MRERTVESSELFRQAHIGLAVPEADGGVVDWVDLITAGACWRVVYPMVARSGGPAHRLAEGGMHAFQILPQR
jgi:hypothetical protein